MSGLSGYRGKALDILSNYKLNIGDFVLVRTSDSEYTGILMPRYELSDDHHLVIKLKNGYNIGVDIDNVSGIEKLEEKENQINRGEKIVPKIMKDLKKVSLVSTGGTIASKIDYRTGGVRPALSADELYAAVPELSEYAVIYAQVLFSEYSENLSARHWTQMAEKVHEEISKGAVGVVLTHGTDTMHYSAAALSFALNEVPVPVVLVGAQRSSDRPSSDAALNLIAATNFAANADVGGVFVAMHSNTDDDVIAVNVGTRVRKNHTSKRDAFESINLPPAALVQGKNIEMKLDTLPRRKPSNAFRVRPNFEEKVALIKYHPSMNPDLIQYFMESDYRGIVIEGTGLGHVGKQYFNALKKAIEHDIVVCMSSQCIWGRVRMSVYETGRDLLNLGVIPLSDMISETALVKTMWALANSKNREEAVDLILKNIAMEYFDVSSFD